MIAPWLLAALLVSGAGRETAGAVGPGGEIHIRNAGRHSIYNLFAAPAGARPWGVDRLDDATIPAGRERTVSIAHRPGRCLYRLKLVLANRTTRIRRADICRGGYWLVTDGGDSFAPHGTPRPADRR